MKVTAIKPAFHNGIRVRPGAEVDVPDAYKATWFVKSETVKPVKPEPKKLKALSELPKEGKSFVEAHDKADLA